MRIDEEKKAIKSIPPPSPKYVYRVKEEPDLFIKEEVLNKILEHCHHMANLEKEALGFLIGDVRKWHGYYSIILEAVSGELDSSPYHVKFSRNAFEEIFDKLDEIDYEYVIIGWYHSHLGYTSFMSSVDIRTQKKYFDEPFHAAIIVDPINGEIKAFRLLKDECVEISYAIF